MRTWLAERQASQLCACHDKYLNVTARGKSIKVACQWLCEKCLPALLEQMAQTMPDIKKVEIGHRRDNSGALEQRFITIPARTAIFEDGRSVSVPEFQISQIGLTVGEFEQFVAATGFKTTAELNGDDETFRENAVLSVFSTSGRLRVPAYSGSCQGRIKGASRMSNQAQCLSIRIQTLLIRRVIIG